MRFISIKSLLWVLVLLLAFGGLFAQSAEEIFYEEEEEDILEQDFITVHYAKKDARLAMLLSTLVPGSGQFYADKKAITTYIFPVLEIGFITGMLYFKKEGDKRTRAYEKYANHEEILYDNGQGFTVKTVRYDRARQHEVEEYLKDVNSADIYNDSYFRLDPFDCQHFYEDIGKYPHYVFGWADWYYTFAADENGNFVEPLWSPTPQADDPIWAWRGTYPYGSNVNVVNPVPFNSHENSPMRKKYIDMRFRSKDNYSRAELFRFGLVFNHLISGLDAIRVTSKKNRYSISDSGVKFNYYAMMLNENITPTFNLTWKF